MKITEKTALSFEFDGQLDDISIRRIEGSDDFPLVIEIKQDSDCVWVPLDDAEAFALALTEYVRKAKL